MTTTTLSPQTLYKGWDNNGLPLAFGKLYTYAAGTTTALATYTDSTGSTPQTNPVILNARGEAPVWIPPNTAYKFVLQDTNGNTISTVDQINNLQMLSQLAGTDTGVANAYVVTLGTPLSSYSGMTFYFIPANTNTGASTINVNGLGVVAIVNPGGGAVTAGQLPAGSVLFLAYQSGSFLLSSPVTSSGATSLASLNVTGSTPPTNGVYLPAANTVGIAANSTNVLDVTTSSTRVLAGGLVVGAPTGLSQGTGTINATGLYINGNALGLPIVTAGGSAIPYTGTTLTVATVSPALVSGGIYMAEVDLAIYASASGSGYKVNMQINGSAPSAWTPLVGVQTVAGASPAACLAVNGGTNITAATVSTSASAPDLVSAKTIFTMASAGSFSVMIAQNTATGTLYLSPNFGVLITRLA